MVSKFRTAMAILYIRVVIHWLLKKEGSINPALSQSLIGYTCLVVEDECHFFWCLCPKYSLIRLQMESTVLRHFPPYYFMPVEQKFIFLLSHSHPVVNLSQAL